MKTIQILILAVIAFAFTTADKSYLCKNGHVEFSSSTPMEKIYAETEQAVSKINAGTGAVEFGILVKSFKFKNALMEEHFNENYIESVKFPKASFKGKISNLSAINFDKDGEYACTMEGEMNIHGVAKQMKVNGKVKVAGSKLTAIADFKVTPQEFGIKIPDLVKDKIAKEISVSVNFNYNQI